MRVVPAVLPVLLALRSAVAESSAAAIVEANGAVSMHVRDGTPKTTAENNQQDQQPVVAEAASATDEGLVRGGTRASQIDQAVLRPTTTKNAQQDQWLKLLSSFLNDAPDKNSKMSEYLFASSHVGELTPSDFGMFVGDASKLTADEPALLDHRMAQLIYFSGLFLMASLVCWIYSERGTRVVFAVLCYMLSLSSMTLAIRNVYVNFDFHYPLWLTASHFLFTGLIGLCILIHQQRNGGDAVTIPPLTQFLKGIFPVSLVFAFSIGSANLGLLYTNAHFYEMVGATTALATAGMGVLMGKTFDSRLMPPLLLVTGGLLICAFGEIVFSVVGFFFCASAVITRALKAIIQHRLMDGDVDSRLSPIQLVVWMSFPSFVIMSLWSASSEGLKPYIEITESFGTQGAVIVTVINACILNTAALFVLQNLGPVAQQLAGQLKGVLSILGSVALFQEQVTIQQIIGYSIIVGGVTWYNRRDMWIKQLPVDGSAERSEASPLVTQRKREEVTAVNHNAI